MRNKYIPNTHFYRRCFPHGRVWTCQGGGRVWTRVSRVLTRRWQLVAFGHAMVLQGFPVVVVWYGGGESLVKKKTVEVMYLYN